MGVWAEACAWLDADLPRPWVNRLAARARAVYARNPRFQKIIRRNGNAGRDWLWAFTRHWLAALIQSTAPPCTPGCPNPTTSAWICRIDYKNKQRFIIRLVNFVILCCQHENVAKGILQPLATGVTVQPQKRP